VMRSEFSEWKNQNIKSIKKCGWTWHEYKFIFGSSNTYTRTHHSQYVRVHQEWINLGKITFHIIVIIIFSLNLMNAPWFFIFKFHVEMKDLKLIFHSLLN
jgi:hypothetical protein